MSEPQIPSGHPFLVPDVLAAHARHRPDALAVEDRWGRATYADLWDTAGAVAEDLTARGIGSDSTVAMLLEPSAAYLALVLATMRTGAVAAPVNPRLTEHEIVTYFDRLKPTHAIAASDERGTWATSGSPLVVPNVASAGSLRDRLFLEPATRPSGAHRARLDPGAAGMAFATGGTTGVPKAALWSHAGLALAAMSSCWNLEVRAADAEIYFAPFSHVTVIPGFLATLCAGGSVLIRERVDPEELAADVATGRYTRMIVTPTVLSRIMEATSLRGVDHPLRIVYGASRSGPDFARQILDTWPRARLWSGYGATEFGAVVRLFPEDVRSDAERGVGRPVSGVHLRIVDQDGEDVPGGPGEIAVRSPWQMLRYRGAEAELLADGSIRSGDIGEIDASGFVHLCGRRKEMIKTGGENVYPTEVERVLLTHPDVVDAGVVGVPDPNWGERVEAYVVLADGVTVSSEDLRLHARGRLSGFKVPKIVRSVERLPYTATMKLDRAGLLEMGEFDGSH